MNSIFTNGVTDEELIGIGFTKHGGESPFDTYWQFENDKFQIYISCFGEIHLSRKNPDTDYIDVVCENIFEVERLLDWIAEGE
jgi:hypothetical protein